jgi:hypothetical protein
MLQSSLADVHGSCTAFSNWPCIARGSNNFNTSDSRLVLADTDLYSLNCKVNQLTDGLIIFCISLGVNHAVVEVLVLIMNYITLLECQSQLGRVLMIIDHVIGKWFVVPADQLFHRCIGEELVVAATH